MFFLIFKLIYIELNYFMKQFLIIPLGGLGKRFTKEGYSIYKPFLKTSNQDTVIDKIINNFPKKLN